MREHARQNGVPADYYDPEARIPRLPMPYRMVDRVLRDLVEEALEVARDDPPTEEPPAPIAPSFGLAVPATLGHVVALQPATAQPIIFVGTSAGKLLCINSLRGEVVGEPIDLGAPLNCMALSPDGCLLAVAVGGAPAAEEGAEATPSTVKLMVVQSDKPFVRTVTAGSQLSGVAVALSFSFDSCVFAAQLATAQLECFRTTITVPQGHAEGDIEPSSPAAQKEDRSGQQPGQGGEDGGEAAEADASQTITVAEPFRVLLTAPQSLPMPGPLAASVHLGCSPTVRQVGELESKHCVHVHFVVLGAHIVDKYALREGPMPPPPAGEEAPPPSSAASEPLQSLRMAHAVSATAMDKSTAMLFTGLSNGTCVVWNAIFGTHLLALSRHKAGVTAAAFTQYELEGESALLVTAAADASVHVHSLQDGSITGRFQNQGQLPKIARILPTSIPLVLLQVQEEEGEGDGAETDARAGVAAVQVLSLEDHTIKAYLDLPGPYCEGARRARVAVPTVGGALAEQTGVILQELPAAPPQRAEGDADTEAEPDAAAAAQAGEGGEGGEGEGDAASGKCRVVSFRLIDMLAAAFPRMVRQQFGTWIQTSGKDTYWQQAGRLPLTATGQGVGVTDRYLSDAAAVGGQFGRGLVSPRRGRTAAAGAAAGGGGVSPRRGPGARGAPSPLQGSHLQMAASGGRFARAPLAAEGSRESVSHSPLPQSVQSVGLAVHADASASPEPRLAGGGRQARAARRRRA